MAANADETTIMDETLAPEFPYSQPEGLTLNPNLPEDCPLRESLSLYLQGDYQSLTQYVLGLIEPIPRPESGLSQSTLSSQTTADSLPRHTPSDLAAIAGMCSSIIRSIPQTVLNFYSDLISAWLFANDDPEGGVPAKYAYTAASGNFGAQIVAYGLDPLIDASSVNPRTPLLAHPNFDLEAFHALLTLLGPTARKRTLYLNVLIRALTCKLVVQDAFVRNQTKAPKVLSYAAATSEREPIRPKPKRTQKVQSIQPTPLPCARCLATATILTTTSTKYTNQLTVKTRGVSLEEYVKTLPANLRTPFKGIFNALTQGTPNHSERQACPVSNSQDRRDLFATSSNGRPTQIQRESMQKAVLLSCKANGLCMKCGRNRTAQSAINHLHCNPGPRNCPPRKSEQCFNGTCTHPVITAPSFWRAKTTFTITPRADNIARTELPNFH